MSTIFNVMKDECPKVFFGRHRGKTIDEVIALGDEGIEFLKWYFNKLNKDVKNPKFEKYKAANQHSIEYLTPIMTNYIKKNSIENLPNDFDELNNILKDLILKNMDIKFRNSKYIAKEYMDYLSLRYSHTTYSKILKLKDPQLLKNIIMALR